MTSDTFGFASFDQNLHRLWLLVVAVLVFPSAGLLAQEEEVEPELDLKSQRIIADYIEAIGGEMRIDSIESFRIKGEYGTEGSMLPFELLVVGDKCLLEYSSSKVVGTKHHKWNVSSGGAAAQDAAVRYQETFPLLTIAYYWTEYPGKISHVGEEEIDGKTVDVLLFQCHGKKPYKRYFDQDSGLMVGQHVNSFFQKFEYTELEDLMVINRQVLYNVNGEVHQIMEYQTTLDVEYDPKDFELPEEIKDQLKTSLKERIEKGYLEPGPDELKIHKGDQASYFGSGNVKR